MPLLTTADGEMIAQTTAILNWIGKTSAIEGDGREYAVSQMLLAEAEDIYALTQKCVPTINVKVDAKGGMEMYDEFWKSKLPAHLDHLDKLCAAGSGFGDTPGSLYLFSMLFQLALIRADIFVAREGKQPGCALIIPKSILRVIRICYPCPIECIWPPALPPLVLLTQPHSRMPHDSALAAWYTKTLHAKTTQKVLKGESSAGSFVQYFVPP